MSDEIGRRLEPVDGDRALASAIRRLKLIASGPTPDRLAVAELEVLARNSRSPALPSNPDITALLLADVQQYDPLGRGHVLTTVIADVLWWLNVPVHDAAVSDRMMIDAGIISLASIAATKPTVENDVRAVFPPGATIARYGLAFGMNHHRAVLALADEILAVAWSAADGRLARGAEPRPDSVVRSVWGDIAAAISPRLPTAEDVRQIRAALEGEYISAPDPVGLPNGMPLSEQRLEIEVVQGGFVVAGRRYELAPKPWACLRALASAPEHTLEARALVLAAWPVTSWADDQCVKNAINKLRGTIRSAMGAGCPADPIPCVGAKAALAWRLAVPARITKISAE